MIITPERIGAEFKQGDLLSSRFIPLCFALILLLPGIALGQQKAEGLYEEYAKKASEQLQDDPLIGIWSGSVCGKRYVLAVVRGREKDANGLC
ncbi:MAG TPA: hypothetical protein DHU55_02550 [Blastocatellia bacterium]|nr:hypothetical protein [Blastocatellia bacterium]